jgi:hypothetical protein
MGLGSGIRDPGVKKAPDPGSATLPFLKHLQEKKAISQNVFAFDKQTVVNSSDSLRMPASG